MTICLTVCTESIDFGSEEFAWNNWGDVLTPAAGTDVWAVYTTSFIREPLP